MIVAEYLLWYDARKVPLIEFIDSFINTSIIKDFVIMICERCGNDMADNAAICPICGTLTTQAAAAKQPPTGYGPYPQGNLGGYERGYTPPRPDGQQQASQGYQGYIPPQPNYGYAPPPYNANPGYAPGINVTVINNMPGSGKNDGALIAEIILSLFGIFGVGWLMAGETTTGVILLICSFVLYWPLIIAGTLLTLGVGLLCLGPMMIAAIIVNAVLLNNALKRKQQFMFVQQPPMQMPPRPQ